LRGYHKHMNLSIEDLEAIKAIVRKTVREELERVMRQQAKAQSVAEQSQPRPEEPKQEEPEHPAEVVARIRRS